MKKELKWLEKSLLKTAEMRDKQIKSHGDLQNNIKGLEEAVATPGLNAIGSETLERELKLTKSRISSLANHMTDLNNRILKEQASIDKVKEDIKNKEDALTPKKGQSIASLDIKFGLKQSGYNDRNAISGLSLSADGRYLFLSNRVNRKFLIEDDQLIPMEITETAGRKGRLVRVGQLLAKPGTDAEGYQMHAYSAADLEYKIATYKTGAYPSASAVDKSYGLFYGHNHDHKLKIYDIWSGNLLESIPVTKGGDSAFSYFGIAPGRVMLCLESGVYIVDVKVKAGTYSPGWKLNTLPLSLIHI